MVASDVLRPSNGRIDWYLAPTQIAERLQGVPGILLPRGRDRGAATTDRLLHRSHAPLLGHLVPVSDYDPSPAGVMALAYRGFFDEKTAPLGWTLRDHQHEDREFIRSRRATLLANAMRLGKTASVVASHDLKAGPLVVVGPLATRGVWASWFRRRWPDVEPLIIQGMTYDREAVARAQLIFVHYDIVAHHLWTGRRIGTLALDEAHRLANGRSKYTQSAMLLASNADRVVALTGTPLWNKPAGLWPLLHLLSPGAWGAYREFTARYAAGYQGPHGWIASGASNGQELQLRLTQVMRRVTWDDVGDAPPLTRTIELVPVSMAKVVDLEVAAAALRDAVSEPTAAGEEARLRRLLGSIKWPVAYGMANRLHLQGEASVIWVWHQEVADQLAGWFKRDGIEPCVVTGKTDHRDKKLDAWREGPARPLIISLGVGQAGIDLSRARHAIFAEIDWTPAVIAQAEMRTFHASRPSTATYLVADHHVDYHLVRTLLGKVDVAARLGVPAAETAIDVLREALYRDANAEEDDHLSVVRSLFD